MPLERVEDGPRHPRLPNGIGAGDWPMGSARKQFMRQQILCEEKQARAWSGGKAAMEGRYATGEEG